VQESNHKVNTQRGKFNGIRDQFYSDV